MARYTFSRNTPQSYEQYSLTLDDDGTFRFSVGYSDPAGDAGSRSTEGRWKRTGDTIAFEITERSDQWAVDPTSATVRGDTLEVAGVGTFSRARS
jgi:hypothetical protein